MTLLLDEIKNILELNNEETLSKSTYEKLVFFLKSKVEPFHRKRGRPRIYNTPEEMELKKKKIKESKRRYQEKKKKVKNSP